MVPESVAETVHRRGGGPTPLRFSPWEEAVGGFAGLEEKGAGRLRIFLELSGQVRIVDVPAKEVTERDRTFLQRLPLGTTIGILRTNLPESIVLVRPIGESDGVRSPSAHHRIRALTEP